MQVKQHLSCTLGAAVAATSLLGWAQPGSTAHAQATLQTLPAVFQAAGPTAASIQSSVEQYLVALGGVNNGVAPGPIDGGFRVIGWDGGGAATTLSPTPFDGFLVSRGVRFTTPGTGFVQAPVDGLAATFGIPSYATDFQAFSAPRLFSTIGSRTTDMTFFLPGGLSIPATTTGFGAVFSDVDDRNGRQPKAGPGPSIIQYFDVDNELLYSNSLPASPGQATFSFFGIVFGDARIARVRIRLGERAPGAVEDGRQDIVMMDDFIFGEPKMLQ